MDRISNWAMAFTQFSSPSWAIPTIVRFQLLCVLLLLAIPIQKARAEAPLFSRALTVEQTLTGWGILEFDSFDSGDPNFNLEGQYDASRQKANGDVAAGGGIDAPVVGNIRVTGRILTKPGAFLSLGPNGSAGDLDWSKTNVGIQNGFLLTNFNEVYPIISSPAGQLQPLTNATVAWTEYIYIYCGCDCTSPEPGDTVITNIYQSTSQSYPSTNCLVGGITTNWTGGQITGYTFQQRSLTIIRPVSTTAVFDYVFFDGDYSVNALSNKVLFLGDASVHVKGDISIGGQGGIWVQTNASCKLYVEGTNTTLAGQGLHNLTGDASKFQYFGLSSNKSVTITTGNKFWGTIYAPQTDLQFKGGGSDQTDLSGAIVCKSALFLGKFFIHYDENLKETGPTAAPVISLTGPAQTNQLSFLLTCVETNRLYSLQAKSALNEPWTNVTSFVGDTFTQNLAVTNAIQGSQFFRLFSE